MAAGLGFKTFTTGEVLTAGDVNGYLMQGVLVFASAAARNAAITSPQEGQFAFTKDTNGLWYYDGAAWVASGATGDIEGVTAGVGITGGGTSGTVTVTNDMATTITASGDIVIGTGSGTYDNLPIGTTGQVLTADTPVSPYKVKWASSSAPSFVGSTCTITTNFPVSTATWTQVTWANELFDAGNIHAASSGEFVTNATGYWLVAGNVQWDTGAGGFGQIYVNRLSGATNTQITGSTRFDSTSYITLAFSVIVSCTSGDKLSLYAYQNSGTTRSLQGGGEPKSYISVSYLGA